MFDLEAARRLLPRYELVRPLGEGGMGVVVEARVPRTGERVAIKLIRPELAGDATASARFRRETEVLAGLMAPSIVRLLDFGETERWRYLVMEYVEGETLGKLLERGKLAPERAVEIITELAQGLAVVHARGVVHRDLKPSNVLVPARGSVRLIDFGIAHDVEGTNVTQAGGFVGTLAYLPPEVLDGKRPTPASDVWQLGALLFECVAGERGFRGDGAAERFRAAVAADPRGAVWTAAFARAMRTEPATRWRDAGELLAALRGAPLTSSPGVPPPQPVAPAAAPASALDRVARVVSWILVAAMLVAAALVIGWLPELARRAGAR